MGDPQHRAGVAAEMSLMRCGVRGVVQRREHFSRKRGAHQNIRACGVHDRPALPWCETFLQARISEKPRLIRCERPTICEAWMLAFEPSVRCTPHWPLVRAWLP